MPTHRPAVPIPLRRAVLVEAGHRCAIPTCRAVPVEIAHIVPWSDVQEHAFDNLIALCPTCHSRFDRGDIDRLSMTIYKRNLGLIGSRYSESERRLLDLFVQNRGRNAVVFPRAMDFDFMYLLKDGLVVKREGQTAIVHSGPMGTFREGPVQYVLTPSGEELVQRLYRGSPVESTESLE